MVWGYLLAFFLGAIFGSLVINLIRYSTMKEEELELSEKALNNVINALNQMDDVEIIDGDKEKIYKNVTISIAPVVGSSDMSITWFPQDDTKEISIEEWEKEQSNKH